jgi:membrane-associated phospholipid phosphatase
VLIAERYRVAVAAVAVAALVLLVVLGAVVFHGRGTAVDTRFQHAAFAHLGDRTADVLLWCSAPVVTVAACAAVAVPAALRRRWDLAALAALAPTVATLLTEYVGKPVVDRRYGPALAKGLHGGSYPSGHETPVVAAAVVLLVVVPRLPVGTAVKAGLALVAVAWTGLAAVGLVRNSYHYLTDTIGSYGLAIAVVLGAALLLDRVATRAPDGRRVSSPGGRDHPRTARGA